MIYLLNELDFELIDFKNQEQYAEFTIWETSEEKVKTYIKNERTRSIFSKQEIRNIFNINEYMQMVQVDKIPLKRYDKIIVWTKSGRYFVLELIKNFS